ncbi:MAG: ribbon-helix-helix protein, CopG family [Cypionkella sp.]
MDNQVTIRLPTATVAALRELAVAEDVSVGQLVRDAIHRDLQRREKAKTPVRADERLVAPLRALLAEDFAFACDWQDLFNRLHAKGYRLAESGGGLILLDHASGQRLCKGSELGYGYAQLLRKFNAPFPGHAHKWLLTRAGVKSIPSAPHSPLR